MDVAPRVNVSSISSTCSVGSDFTRHESVFIRNVCVDVCVKNLEGALDPRACSPPRILKQGRNGIVLAFSARDECDGVYVTNVVKHVREALVDERNRLRLRG